MDAIIYPVIEPTFNPLLTFLFLGETMRKNAIIGGACVLLGVFSRSIYQLTQLLNLEIGN